VKINNFTKDLFLFCIKNFRSRRYRYEVETGTDYDYDVLQCGSMPIYTAQSRPEQKRTETQRTSSIQRIILMTVGPV
jgi:hypothetical protein